MNKKWTLAFNLFWVAYGFLLISAWYTIYQHMLKPKPQPTIQLPQPDPKVRTQIITYPEMIIIKRGNKSLGVSADLPPQVCHAVFSPAEHECHDAIAAPMMPWEHD